MTDKVTARGYARVTDLEPGMEFQAREGGGFQVFHYLDSAGRSGGRRWVRVTTRDGHRLVYEWDARVSVVVDRS